MSLFWPQEIDVPFVPREGKMIWKRFPARLGRLPRQYVLGGKLWTLRITEGSTFYVPHRQFQLFPDYVPSGQMPCEEVLPR